MLVYFSSFGGLLEVAVVTAFLIFLIVLSLGYLSLFVISSFLDAVVRLYCLILPSFFLRLGQVRLFLLFCYDNKNFCQLLNLRIFL